MTTLRNAIDWLIEINRLLTACGDIQVNSPIHREVIKFIAQQKAPEQDVQEALDRVRKDADNAYIRYINQMEQKDCLGYVQKIKSGEFGSEQLEAHCKGRELLGQHRGICHAIKMLSPYLTQRPAAPPSEVMDALKTAKDALLCFGRHVAILSYTAADGDLQRMRHAVKLINAALKAAQRQGGSTS